jgi:hypothetical protein
MWCRVAWEEVGEGRDLVTVLAGEMLQGVPLGSPHAAGAQNSSNARRAESLAIDEMGCGDSGEPSAINVLDMGALQAATQSQRMLCAWFIVRGAYVSNTHT